MNIQEWQKLSTAEKKRLLRAAGHQPNNYAYRAFNFIPSHIRDDINYVIRREQARAEAGAIYA
ncbi:MAG: hypothetical protein ACTS9Y_13460 [Methylophilus sp.]|uniref:hypothetical protein n=1 Tax=Methylophilus sp. TaxID=29541 RepID=UPI003FA06B31